MIDTLMLSPITGSHAITSRGREDTMFIGIDTGHTNVKAVAFDSDWNDVAEYGIEAGMEHPAEDRHEIPIDQRWGVTLECLDELRDRIEEHRANRRRADEGIDGIGLAGGGGGLYPLDANREPFMNGIPLLDERGKGIIDRWKEDGTYEEISAITGVPLPPGSALLSLRWLKENEPDRYDAIEHVLQLKDVVRYKLTGDLALEISDATFSLTNHRTQEYDDDLFDLAGVADKRDAFPELKPTSYEVAGHTTEEIRRETGIEAGVPVVTGAHDACANTLGVGAISEDIVTTAGGTWSLSTKVIDSPAVDLERWCCENFLERGTWMLEIATVTGTISLDWFVEEFCEPERRRAEGTDRTVWDLVEAEIADVDTNAIFHPFLFGNPYGYLYRDNASGSFTGLRPGDGRMEMLRAVYEAIAFMHRWQVDLFDEAFDVEEVRFTGGAARSDFWAQMFADVMDTKVTLTAKDESGCFGAAMLAAIGVGEIAGLDETTELVEIAEEYHPSDTDVDYDAKYEAFRKLTGPLETIWGEHYALRS